MTEHQFQILKDWIDERTKLMIRLHENTEWAYDQFLTEDLRRVDEQAKAELVQDDPV